jgi:hypothetical protein
MKIENAINNNKSILISPYPDSKIDIQWQTIDNSSKPFHFRTFSAGDVLVTSIDPGIYYIKSITITEDAQKVDLEHKTPHGANIGYNSSIGDVEIKRTPKKELEEFEREVKGKFSTWTEKGERVINLKSYYITKFIFDSDRHILGTLTVEPNEVILMPTINISFVTKIDACQYKGDDGSSLDFFVMLPHLVKDVLDYDDFNHLYWSCPIAEMNIFIKKISLENFLSKVNKKYFPNGVLDRTIVRDFEFENIFKSIEKIEELDGAKTIQYKIESLENAAKKYITHGNTSK